MTTAPATTLPPLENGDRLTSEEFWRRYRERHDIKRAEHIEGVVYVPSPVGPAHMHPHGVLTNWVGAYAIPRTLFFGDNGSVLLPARQTVQPDVFLLASGTAATFHDDHIECVPDLVTEIAASSASYDLHVKKPLYERSGVREYIVWRTWDRALDWFRLEDGTYQRIEPKNGLIESSTFPGLILDVDALLAEDYATVLARVSPTTHPGREAQ